MKAADPLGAADRRSWSSSACRRASASTRRPSTRRSSSAHDRPADARIRARARRRRASPASPSADLRQGSPRLVNIFASWCMPCRAEAPQLLSSQRRGVPIDGIAVRDRPEDVAAFLAQLWRSVPARSAPTSTSGCSSHLARPACRRPSSIDGSGIIRHQHIGAIMPEDVAEHRRGLGGGAMSGAAASPLWLLARRARPALADSLAAAPRAICQQASSPDPRQEAQAKALMETLRCLVCQGQSIADSDAEMAGDMRASGPQPHRGGREPEADPRLADRPLRRLGQLRSAGRAADLAALGGADPARRCSACSSPAAASAAEALMGWLIHRSSLALLVFAACGGSCGATRRRCNCSARPCCVALAGYAWQGRPGLAGSPKAAAGASGRCPESAVRRSCGRSCSAASTRAVALADHGRRLSARAATPAAAVEIIQAGLARNPARRRSLGRPRQCAGRPRRRHDEPGGPARLPARRARSRPIIPGRPSSSASRWRRAAIMPRPSGSGGIARQRSARARPIARRSRSGCGRSSRRGRAARSGRRRRRATALAATRPGRLRPRADTHRSPRQRQAGSNGRPSASATAWWRILPPETLRPSARCGSAFIAASAPRLASFSDERQGRVVEREGRGARDRARHVGDAIMDDAVDLVDRIVVRRRAARSRSSRPGRSRCRPAPSRASSSSACRG